jgi:4-carboxymuconolactone decarboxylase
MIDSNERRSFMDSDRDRQGREMYRKVFGKDPGPDRTGLRAMTIDHLFGEVWARPALEPRLRSLLTIAILAADGRNAELVEHVRGALHLGWSAEELIEAMMHVAHYAGWPAGHSGQDLVLDAVDPDKKFLPDLAATIADAEMTGDAKFFEELLHDQFVFRRAKGEVIGKARFLAELDVGPERHVHVESVDILGKHRATIKTIVKMSMDCAMTPFDNFLLFLRESDHRWRLFCWANERGT